MMKDPRYQVPVGGLSPDELRRRLRLAIKEMERRFPGCGITLFVFDFGGPGKGLSYISNAERDSGVAALEEWIRHQRAGQS